MTYDQWKTRSPDDDSLGYLCGGQGWNCGNTVSIPRDLCEECLEELAAEEAMAEFYQWEPVVVFHHWSTP
ncbi:MAG: hypothetical protein ACOY4R_27475 [Pseudomonadota bacterium]